MPSASSVSAACFIVAQSDWLPMMIATGLDGIVLPEKLRATRGLRKEAADYRNGPCAGKAKGGILDGTNKIRGSGSGRAHGTAGGGFPSGNRGAARRARARLHPHCRVGSARRRRSAARHLEPPRL